ncbi:MAG: PhaM family polyhydroxyalkanoate granule multifunctional regulatory protein [Burkholderiales bacterium]|jgi:hypothetical protein
MAGSKTAFDMSKMAIGGIGQMLDSVEFVKRAWSTLNIPSTLVPTVDIEELDKRIADLKAVEQWLNVNLSMLHGTIQGLEIQRGTLAAVKAFGATLGTLPMASAEGVAARAKPAAPPAPAPAPAPEAAEPAPPARKGAAASAATLPLAGISPTAWWNLLQQNFNQVAEAAMSGGGLQNAAVNAMKVAGSAAGEVAKAAAPKPARAPAKRVPAKRKRAPSKPRAPKATP